MENITAGTIYAFLLICVACASVAGFYLGRKREATDIGVSQGSLYTDITYIKRSMDDMKITVEKLGGKFDDNRRETEKEIRGLVVSLTELTASYKSLHKRVDTIDTIIKSVEAKGEM